ncbi:hypothetical protein [Paenibacillus chitinolyticus]
MKTQSLFRLNFNPIFYTPCKQGKSAVFAPKKKGPESSPVLLSQPDERFGQRPIHPQEHFRSLKKEPL